LEFADENHAREALAASSGKCLGCAENLEIVQTFRLSGTFAAGVLQGLWLESLATDVMAKRTDLVWSGQMIGTKEIDVLGILGGKTILVECKDTSFGQTDLAVIALKADQVRPDFVIVISTRDIHANVQDDIDKLASRGFKVISESASGTIAERLGDLLDDLIRTEFQTWLGATTTGSDLASQLIREMGLVSS